MERGGGHTERERERGGADCTLQQKSERNDSRELSKLGGSTSVSRTPWPAFY